MSTTRAVFGAGTGRLLLFVARDSIAARLEDRSAAPLPENPPDILLPRGAFVSLHLAGDLRGCIGSISPRESLVRTVAHCAAAAAFEDPRFPPLTPSELPGVDIEISILTQPVPVTDPGQIEIGRHGLIIGSGPRRGLLLPQVAVEQGWDVATFLRQCCRKAGLPDDAWQRGAEIEAFSAEVFSESAGKTS